MQYIWKFALSASSTDDCFHFLQSPDKETCKKAILANAEFAGEEWKFLYDEFILMLEELPNSYFTNFKNATNNIHHGGPVRSGTWGLWRYPIY